MLIGTSMGGARPKAVVEDDQGLWIAKFNRLDDHWNHARTEHAMLVLARACGIHSAESRTVWVPDTRSIRKVQNETPSFRQVFFKLANASPLRRLGSLRVPALI
ncbi:MAG: HipA domain-containing protein [Gammaproteobacteria bacterium]